MKEIRHLKTLGKKTKEKEIWKQRQLWQNEQNADTALLLSLDNLFSKQK